MAGVKGRSGGVRPGSGRKPKDRGCPAPGETPLAFLLAIMNDTTADPVLRVRAAVAAAQYVHPKRGEGGKKEEQGKKAAEAAAGGFSTPTSPKLVVSNG